mgnify:CR=1 FL=1
MKLQKNVKLNPISNLFLDIANPDSEVTAITAEILTKYGSVETKEGVLKVATALYKAVATLATLRESKGTSEEDLELLKVAAEEVRKTAGAWFMMLGSRDPAKIKETKRRPLYSVTNADFVILGEISADARTAVNGDLSKVDEAFLTQLVFASARLIKGEPLQRVNQSDIKKSRTTLNQLKADKAKKTKENNAKKAEETAKREAEAKAEAEAKDKKIADLEKQVKDYKEHTIDIALVVTLVNKSHATAEEKQAILDALYNRSKKDEEPEAEKKQ